MRLTTWNVNSIRTRLPRVLDFLERSGTDVLAMQETKVTSEKFPREAFAELGYEVVSHGYNQWNGVAIASRVGITDAEVGFPGMPTWGDPPAAEARALGATCDGVRVWTLYVPNGRERGHPHYDYKLEWLGALRSAAQGWLETDPGAQIALVGDWNIAPLDTDVWDMSVFANATHVSEPERAALRAIVDTGYAEVTRRFVPHQYTYWDYQQLCFPKNRGMRIDFIHASPALAERVTGASIERNERKGKAPSDHVPVVVDIE